MANKEIEEKEEEMKLQIDPSIFAKWPEARLGVVVALGVKNGQSPEILSLLREQEKQAYQKLASVVVSEHPQIVPWREAYRAFGSKPNKHPSSVEALAKRAQKGNPLPDINPLVNLYNALSLKYLLPFGGEDLDQVKGDICLTFAKGDESGKYIGSDALDTCEPGEVAYLDDLGFICRRWNWREADRTKLTSETQNVILVVEALPPTAEETLKEATQELAQMVKQYLGGEVTTHFLDKNNQLTVFKDRLEGSKAN